MPFRPREVLFSPSVKCNLSCIHCNADGPKDALSVKTAEKFLVDCKKNGIMKVGFTGGEPFLAGDFLYPVTEFAAKNGFLFTQIVTNGVWYKNGRDLQEKLERLFRAGYDGSILLSVDAYHRQDVKKLARFIKTAAAVWRRPDLVSIVYVTGRDAATKQKISKLSKLLGARLLQFGGSHPHIRSADLFIKIAHIGLSPIGKAAHLRDPWDDRWFKEDMCKGPGNVFFVEPSGAIKPCCGYATGSEELTIGNIKRDSVAKITKNIRQNRVVCAIFDLGLSRIREMLARRGVKFPGRTSNNCFFCHYILTKMPGALLEASLKR